VTTRSLPSFLHVSFGFGDPEAIHSNTIGSPAMISLFSIAFTNDGGSENKKALSEEYRSCQH
jgi:hypothetical protein